jgi:hypothetical protein
MLLLSLSSPSLILEFGFDEEYRPGNDSVTLRNADETS